MKIERLKTLRKNNNYTQKEIANFLKISQQHYSLYELNIRQMPIDLLVKLSYLYNTSIDYICGITDKKEPYNRLSN